MIEKFKNCQPRIHETAYTDKRALLIGRVSVGKMASVWPYAVLRGDVEEIIVGEKTNIQDGTLVHTNYDLPAVLGRGVTVGHGAVLHGCRIADNCLIGMGAIMLDGSSAGDWTILAAGSLVPERRQLEGGFLYMGTPAQKKREITGEEKKLITRRAEEYVMLAEEYK